MNLPLWLDLLIAPNLLKFSIELIPSYHQKQALRNQKNLYHPISFSYTPKKDRPYRPYSIKPSDRMDLSGDWKFLSYLNKKKWLAQISTQNHFFRFR